MTATKTEKFAWNETNAATAISMYEGIIAADGLEARRLERLRQCLQRKSAFVRHVVMPGGKRRAVSVEDVQRCDWPGR